jgi:hypothetical protein
MPSATVVAMADLRVELGVLSSCALVRGTGSWQRAERHAAQSQQHRDRFPI